MTQPQQKPDPIPDSSSSSLRRLAGIVFATILLVFIVSRLLVIGIMTRTIPDFYLHLGGTHVHHLNYGIFMLSAVGAILLFAELSPTQRQWSAAIYGFGMALTFDEFGMWLHLGGSYWQRASFDAIIVLLSFFGLLAFAPRRERLRSLHYVSAIGMLILIASFYFLLFRSLHYAGKKVSPRLKGAEQSGPQ